MKLYLLYLTKMVSREEVEKEIYFRKYLEMKKRCRAFYNAKTKYKIVGVRNIY